MAVAQLLALGQAGFLVDGVVGQPVLPFAFRFRAQRRVERGIRARQAPVHVGHFAFGDAQLVGQLGGVLGREIAFLDGADIGLGLAQIEEQLLLRRGGAQLHHAPGAQHIFLDRGADPPHRIGGEAEALVGIEALDRLHQADIAFGDDFGNRQAIAAIAHGDLGDQAQMAGDQPARGFRVAMLLPALGEHVFVFRRQKRETCGFRSDSAKDRLRWKGREGHGCSYNPP